MGPFTKIRTPPLRKGFFQKQKQKKKKTLKLMLLLLLKNARLRSLGLGPLARLAFQNLKKCSTPIRFPTSANTIGKLSRSALIGSRTTTNDMLSSKFQTYFPGTTKPQPIL